MDRSRQRKAEREGGEAEWTSSFFSGDRVGTWYFYRQRATVLLSSSIPIGGAIEQGHRISAPHLAWHNRAAIDRIQEMQSCV